MSPTKTNETNDSKAINQEDGIKNGRGTKGRQRAQLGATCQGFPSPKAMIVAWQTPSSPKREKKVWRVNLFYSPPAGPDRKSLASMNRFSEWFDLDSIRRPPPVWSCAFSALQPFACVAWLKIIDHDTMKLRLIHSPLSFLFYRICLSLSEIDSKQQRIKRAHQVTLNNSGWII